MHFAARSRESREVRVTSRGHDESGSRDDRDESTNLYQTQRVTEVSAEMISDEMMLGKLQPGITLDECAGICARLVEELSVG